MTTTIPALADNTTDQPTDWTQDDLVLVTKRADGLRQLANFVEDNPQLAADLRYSLVTQRVYVHNRAAIEAFIRAAQAAGLPIVEFSDETHGGVEIGVAADAKLRVYTKVESLGDAPPPPPRPTYRPLLAPLSESPDPARRAAGRLLADGPARLRRNLGPVTEHTDADR